MTSIIQDAGFWGLVIVVGTHAAGTIWWMSRVNTTLTFIAKDIEEWVKELKAKDGQIATVWKRMDEINQRLSRMEGMNNTGGK